MVLVLLAALAVPADVVWYRDVQPIVQARVAPHMHALGRRIRAESDATCLVDIPSWDFRWQQIYFFGAPLQLAAGTRLRLSCSWDNPTTRTVTWGENTAAQIIASRRTWSRRAL